jgi:hypothetical protein
MRVRATNLRRVVLIEPPLVSGKLWPVFGPLREALSKSTDGGFAALALEAFGIDGEALLDRDHRALIEGLHTPVDVILGDA